MIRQLLANFRGTGPLLFAVLFLALAAIALFAVWRDAEARIPFWRTFSRYALPFVSVWSVVAVVLVGIKPGESEVVARSDLILTPFTAIDDLWTASGPARWLVLGNMFLFIPAGLFITLWLRELAWWKVALGLSLLSLAIELTQFALITNRTAQTDDVIMNTLGGLIGIGLGHAAIRAHDRWRRGDSNP